MQTRERVMQRLVAISSLLLISTVGASAQGLPVPSYWKDGAGSEMSLHSIDAKGAFTGTFVSHAASFACANAPFDLHGQAHGHHVRFSVVWKNTLADCKSHTSWSGNVAGNTMHTWWVQTSGEKRAVKKTHGADTFVKQ